MRVAYLVNRYPQTSHSFIRREIHGLELLGIQVARYSLRRVAEALVTEADQSESERTRCVEDEGTTGVALATLREAARAPLRFVRTLALTFSLGWRSDRGILRNLAYLGAACVLVGWFRKQGVAHVHAHFGTNPAAVALLTAALGGPSFSFTVHGPEEFDKPQTLKLREKVQRAAFVVAISSYGRAQLSRWALTKDWSKIQVVRCGVDDLLLRSPPSPVPDTNRLVCIARLSEQKGHLLLMEAAARLAADGVPFHLTLAGDGPLRAEIEARIHRHGLEKNVHIAGWMSEHQVRDVILASRAVVLPSFAEGLPVVLMEALALGRPVITTSIAGVPELVEHGKSGWVIPAGTVDELVEAMTQALRAPVQQLTDMGSAGAAVVAKRHDVKQNATLLAAHFRKVAGGDSLAVPQLSTEGAHSHRG